MTRNIFSCKLLDIDELQYPLRDSLCTRKCIYASEKHTRILKKRNIFSVKISYCQSLIDHQQLQTTGVGRQTKQPLSGWIFILMHVLLRIIIFFLFLILPLPTEQFILMLMRFLPIIKLAIIPVMELLSPKNMLPYIPELLEPNRLQQQSHSPWVMPFITVLISLFTDNTTLKNIIL